MEHKIQMDEEDWQKFGAYRMHIEKKNYVIVTLRKSYDGRFRQVKLHREILGLTDPKVHVDHINGDSLDNRKSNLRVCTSQQNRLNESRRRNNKSGFKGVSFFKGDYPRKKPWSAEATLSGKRHHLGYYETPELASAAYEAFASAHHKEFYYKKGCSA